MFAFDQHYIEWRTTRFKVIVEQLGKEYFNNKTLLELGGGLGDLGNLFSELNCKVTSVDARSIYTQEGKKKYPHINFFTKNLEEDFSDLGKFDIILHTGLFYHLKNPTKHFEYVMKTINDCLIFETSCTDASDINPYLYQRDKLEGGDGTFSGFGCRPTPNFVEHLFNQYNLSHKIIIDSKLNANMYIYDWENKETQQHFYNEPTQYSDKKWLRRLWICKK